MSRELPVVLTASVSNGDCERFASTLSEAGFVVRSVDSAAAVNDQLTGCPGSCVLVIDSGLLEMSHDAQWRRLRSSNPDLGTVVHSLIDSNGGTSIKKGRTILVHPDHPERLLKAVQSLAATELRV